MRIFFCLLIFIFFSALMAEEQKKESENSELSAGTEAEIAVEGKKTNSPQEQIVRESKIKGLILEKGTKKPLSEITFYIKEKNIQVETNKFGEFSFMIEPGTYTIILPVVGYEKTEVPITVNKNEDLELIIRMESLVINPYEIVVRDKKVKPDVSAQSIKVEEAVATPGTNRDVLKAVTNMPGVNSISVFNGIGSGLVIRGSAPEDSVYHVNDQWLPMLYHFFGFESIIEPELVESIEYHAGGFSPEYIEAMGGVITVNLRDPRTDRLGGYVNLSLLSSSFMVETPITEKDSIAIGMKRGFLDYYTKIALENSDMKNEINFSQYPLYYDGIMIYTHKFSKNNKFRLISVGSFDTIKVSTDDEAESSRFSNSMKNETKFGTVIGEWFYKSGNLKSVFSPMAGITYFTFDMGKRANFTLTEKLFTISEKAEYKLNDWNTLRFGGRVLAAVYEIDASLFAPPKEGEISYNPYDVEINDSRNIDSYDGVLFLGDNIKLGDFTLFPGIAALYSNSKIYYIDPRFSVKYDLNKAWALKFATGLYSKLPQPDEYLKPWGNAKESEKSLHFVGGVETKFTDVISLDTQAFYKRFFNLVSRTDPENPAHYENVGIGYAYGLEMLLRHSMTDNFFGWLSYSFGVSKRKDTPDSYWRYFDMDITHNLTLVASYKLNKYWQFGGKFNMATGLPYTDLEGVSTLYDADNDYYMPIYEGKINQDRMPLRHQLDIRIDKYWLFDTWILSTYLDVQNVYLKKNPIGYTYQKDFSDKEKVTLLPIMVFLGLKGDF